MNNRSTLGFTLSELLVSLAVLGLIAAFAIPKVLSSVADSSTRAIGKETIGAISAAYDSLKAQNNGFVSRATAAPALMARMSGLAAPTSTNAGALLLSPSFTGNANTAIQLASGGTIAAASVDTFTRTATAEGVISFLVDPDGLGAFGPITVHLGYDGRVWVHDTAYAGGTSAVSGLNTQYNLAETNVITPTVVGTAANSDTTWYRL